MSTSASTTSQTLLPQQLQEGGDELDVDAQTKANTLANAAATSSSPAPHILSVANAPKDEVALHSTPTSSSSAHQ